MNHLDTGSQTPIFYSARNGHVSWTEEGRKRYSCIFFSVVDVLACFSLYLPCLCAKFNVWSIFEARKYCRVGVESIGVEFPKCVEVWSSPGSHN